MKRNDLFPEELFRECVESGLVSARAHPTERYVIYNYTKECAYNRVWNECTLRCRGLIVDEDGYVLARPFLKFFNYGEPGAPTLDLHAPARVTDKVDGSLGILYPLGDGSYAIATRGSFESEQAAVGTRILNEKYADWSPEDSSLTYLFEIIYPGNRIVVNYGDTEDLFLLAVIDNETGENLDTVYSTWPGPCVQTFPHKTLAEALAAPPRPNSEGLVVESNGARVKIKQEDYVELHRLVTGLSEKRVWEQLSAGKTYDEICEPIPEEFHGWVKEVGTELTAKAEGMEATARLVYEYVIRHLPTDFTRKDFALAVTPFPSAVHRSYLFMLLDGKDIRPAVWKTLRPTGIRTPRDWSEEEE